jgi:hypothetical protein
MLPVDNSHSLGEGAIGFANRARNRTEDANQLMMITCDSLECDSESHHHLDSSYAYGDDIK